MAAGAAAPQGSGLGLALGLGTEERPQQLLGAAGTGDTNRRVVKSG